MMRFLVRNKIVSKFRSGIFISVFSCVLFSFLCFIPNHILCVAFQSNHNNIHIPWFSLPYRNTSLLWKKQRQLPCYQSKENKNNESLEEDKERMDNTDGDAPPQYKSKLYNEMLRSKKKTGMNLRKKRNPTTNSNKNKETPKKVKNAAVEKKKQKLKRPKKSSKPKDESISMKQTSDDEDEDDEDERIDMFLMGATMMAFDEKSEDGLSMMHASLGPGETVDFALRCLRYPEDGSNNNVNSIFLQQFCVPLSRSERWGNGNNNNNNEWKEIIRGSLTPAMLTGRLLSSPNFSILLKWDRLDVTEGLSIPNNTKNYSQYLCYNNKNNENSNEDGNNNNYSSAVAFVSVAMFYSADEDSRTTGPPVMVQFTLKKLRGLWLIDKADVIAMREWFW